MRILKKALFCLRPEPDCSQDVQRLRQMGCEAYALPVMQIIEDSEQAKKALLHAQDTPNRHLIATSKQTAHILVNYANTHNQIRQWPVWCVGRGTAELLNIAGFNKLHSAQNTAASLAEKIVSEVQNGLRAEFFWLSGHDIHTDLLALLHKQQISVSRWVIYHSQPANPQSDEVKAKLLDASNYSCAFLVMSSKTLSVFIDWCVAHGLENKADRMRIIAISKEQEEQARKAGFKAIITRGHSREEILALACDFASQ